MAQLQPMADSAEQMFAPMRMEDFVTRAGWAAIHLSLWHYRHGDYASAENWCQRIDGKENAAALQATISLIHAMTEFREGKAEAARADLAKGNGMLKKKFQGVLDRGAPNEGFWFDWIFANVLAQEANKIIGESSKSSSRG